MKLFIGSYAPADQNGLYCAEFDPDSGQFSLLHAFPGLLNPSFLALSASGEYLYAVSETISENGSIAAFRVSVEGRLDLLNRQDTLGAAPCHVGLDAAQQRLVCSNYLGGSLSVHAVNSDGSLSPALQWLNHHGQGPHPERQQSPHPHSAVFDAAHRQWLVPDLGCDRLFVYAGAEPCLVLQQEYALPPGSGPRHLALHPAGKVVYLVNELASTVTVFLRAGEGLRAVQAVSCLPDNFAGASTAAHIQVSPDARHLYVSNRGHDSLALFTIAADGRLTPSGHTPGAGRTPRHFSLSPDGHFVLVANQDSGTLNVFRRNVDTGQLRDTGHSLRLPAPSCVVMA
ncbi:MAG: 3-carboxymuconate cyclase [Proteobacteria bacterium]|nr:3-carboxymuconate cyclase [Pseudomonadota bacterium]